MLFLCLQTVISLAVLLASAEKFVEGAAGSARLLGVSPFLIGVFILGFGTSAPELVVSVLSALKGNPGVALGNAYGSNIANIGLVLGVTALLAPLSITPDSCRQEMLFLVGVTVLTLLLFWDRALSRADAALLMGCFCLFIGWTVYRAKNPKSPEAPLAPFAEQEPPHFSGRTATLYLLGGGALLMISSHFLVDAAVDIAKILGMSDLVIGLTLVATGTSLPELMASLMAIRKNESAMAFGNVIGSNLLNTLVVVGTAGLLQPFQAEAAILSRDLPLMTMMTVALVGLRFLPVTGQRLGRMEGGVYFALYGAYMVYILTHP